MGNVMLKMAVSAAEMPDIHLPITCPVCEPVR
jgi:hypothetical protein